LGERLQQLLVANVSSKLTERGGEAIVDGALR
jgi:hypothetical protein